MRTGRLASRHRHVTDNHLTPEQESARSVIRVANGLLTVAAICTIGLMACALMREWEAVIVLGAVAVVCSFAGCLGLTAEMRS
jgi:4-hydroxybenzoate polyprenyltransferase